MSIRVRLVLVLVTMSAMAMLALTTLFTIGNILIATERATNEHDMAIASTNTRLARALTEEAGAVRLYLASADERALIPYTQGLDAERIAYATLESDMALSEAARRSVAEVREASAQWRDGFARGAIEAVRQGRVDAANTAIVLLQDKELYGLVRARLDALQDHLAAPGAVQMERTAILSTIRLAVFVASILGGIISLIVTARMLGALVWKPLTALVTTARRVEQGDDVSFQLHRRDEIGDLAAALERMRLHIAEGRRQAAATAQESSVMNFFTELTAFTEADVDVARAMLTAVDELVAPERAIVHISNRSRDRATPDAHLGDDPGQVLTLRGLEACPGVRRGSLYVTTDVARPLAVRCSVHDPGAGTVVCVPLTALGETVGAVHLSWSTPDALPLPMRATISRLAEHTALSIGNRRLVHALQGMANTDARTGLPNNRSFDDTVESALARPDTTGGGAVLMLDLDHFKAFNDRYGHPGGDEALRTFAGVLRASVRDGDVAARYGGEEFAVYLPGVEADGAMEIAERIRSRTEHAVIALGPGTTAKINVSIGIALYPGDGADRISLLRAADGALYRAKEGGRNRVATTTEPTPLPRLSEAS